MTDTGQVCREIIVNALDWYELPKSEAAIRLLCMIAAHESGDFHYIHQVGGPAVSIFQMEPASYDDICSYIKSRQGDFPLVIHDMPRIVTWMAFDPLYATAICRLYLLRIPEPFPQPENIEALACYAKTYWNTELGAAQWTDYRDAWQRNYL